MRLKFSYLFAFIMLLALLASACAKARHVAVVGDAAYSRAVFALDDAQYQLCQAKTLDKETCDRLDPIVKSALQDVKAVTAALQASPSEARVPVSLPDLLAHLSQAQAIVAPLTTRGGPVADLAAKAADAINQAVALLRQFAGA